MSPVTPVTPVTPEGSTPSILVDNAMELLERILKGNVAIPVDNGHILFHADGSITDATHNGRGTLPRPVTPAVTRVTIDPAALVTPAVDVDPGDPEESTPAVTPAKGRGKYSLSVYMPTSTLGSVQNIALVIAQASDDERASGMDWYRSAHLDVVTLAASTGRDPWQVAQVLSIISPQRRWEHNVRDCAHTIEAFTLPSTQRIPYLASKRIAAPSGWRAFERAFEVLDGSRELVEKGSPKTFNFAQTILDPDNWQGVTVDSHAAALWSDTFHLVAGAYQIPYSVYRRCAADYAHLAALMGILPSQCQAIAWVTRRRLLSDVGSPME